MAETKTDIGLRESARLFSEAMNEHYFKYNDENKCMLVIVAEGDDLLTSVVGADVNLVNAVATAMHGSKCINKIMGTAFMLANKEDLLKLVKENDGNNSD